MTVKNTGKNYTICNIFLLSIETTQFYLKRTPNITLWGIEV